MSDKLTAIINDACETRSKVTGLSYSAAFRELALRRGAAGQSPEGMLRRLCDAFSNYEKAGGATAA